jgi:hypothetical protein
MKMRPKNKSSTFGDFVADVYQFWGRRQAGRIIMLAIKLRLIEFRGSKWFVTS